MENFFIHIKSDNNCIIKIQDKTYELNLISNCLSLKISDSPPSFFAYVYPVSNNNCYLAYTIKFQIINEKLFCDSKNVEIFKLPENHFVIELKNPKIENLEQNEEYSETIMSANEKFLCIYEIGKDIKVRIKHKNKMKTYFLQGKFLECEVSKFSSGVALEFDGKEKNTLIFFNEEFYLFKGSKIEINGEVIKTMNNLLDLQGRGVVKEFCVKNKKIEETKCEFVYLNKGPKEIKKQNLIPLAFLESVRSKDIVECRKFLSETLNQRLSDDHIFAYFKNIGEIEIVPFYNDKTCLVFDENKKNPKVFTFELFDNKIVNITDR